MKCQPTASTGFSRLVICLGIACAVPLVALLASRAALAAENRATSVLKQLGVEQVEKGVCAVVGLPEADQPAFAAELAEVSGSLVYFQSCCPREVAAVREAAQKAGLLGTRVFVDRGEPASIHLADNLAGFVLVAASAAGEVSEAELVRVLHPGGRAIVAQGPNVDPKEITKPFPKGIDPWSHPYHGPDNNPQSTDQLVRAPYLTQFLADPKFCSMPQVSVGAGGRVFRAFGHIAHKANQNATLNTLICVNGYNGTILWRRPLKEGFMIHRNTMIATPEVLYLGDDESCKRIDARTGRVIDEIVVPEGISDGPVWKWMALVDGVLFALVGGPEDAIHTQTSEVAGMGHWPWGMWEGHDYKDPKTSFGFGRTFVAIDPDTKKVVWSHREDEYVDGRGVCMTGGRIFYYCPEKVLGCVDAKTGKTAWTTTDERLLEAIGPNAKSQHYTTGYSTQTYLKCTDRFLLFAGPQRSRLVMASADDGKLLWDKEHGNYQVVLRDDGFYAAGPQTQDSGFKFDYATGNVLATFPNRRACTRATGSVDSVFFRASGGTVRLETATNNAQHIAPMRPPCQDGVIISDGHLYWGPWMCGCQLSLYGHIGLAPAGDFNPRPGLGKSRLTTGSGNGDDAADAGKVASFEVQPADWPTYLGDNARTSVARAAIPRAVRRQWAFQTDQASMPSAPVAAGNTVFLGDRAGVVRAIDAAGKVRWQAPTGGAVFFPPTVADGRVFAGSADGCVHAFEAATGRKLWAFRVAPAEQWIPVYGKLMSRWPVSGGLVVKNGVVYAAAGIAHYDGTHVVALDAATGRPKWYNDTSGTLSEKVNSGISLQGALRVVDGELRFLGGGVCETARYDLTDGTCKSEPSEAASSRFHTAFYAHFPDYGKYVWLDHSFADGRSLVYDATYDGSRHSPLALLGPYPADAPKIVKPASRWGRFRQKGPNPKAFWAEKSGRRFFGFVVSDDVLLAAGHTTSEENATPFLAAVNVADGTELWNEPLPAAAVKGGLAVDAAGRILVSLENGQVLCYAANAK